MKMDFDITKITEEIVMQAKENQEEFIFETIRPYCENILQMKINKEELKQILLNSMQKQQPCDDCISRAKALEMLGDEPENWTDTEKEIQELNDYRWFKSILEDLSSVTPQPKTDVLDKIRAEIEKTTSRYTISRERGAMGQVEWSDRLIKESEVLEIIDKYKTESEDKNGN